MSNQQFEFRPSGSIEFERVEPEAVARELNTPGEDTPDGPDADPLSINFGRAKDFKPSATERMLAGTTIDWLIAFPAESRPKALCDRFPHVANRLASDWSHKARSAQNVQELATDPRWGSAGFPALVQGELQQLRRQLADFQPTE
jgi:hypothetical protein